MEFTLHATFPTTPDRLYRTWMDSKGHTAMTGGEASMMDQVGEAFTAWDGYIEGTNLALEPGRRIVQSWRTVEFADDEPDSRIEILLEATDQGTRLTLVHSDLPDHGTIYEQGWIDNYFEPMQAYFQA
ncbi:MAG: SRPBCC domain-containing protein [Lewinellaceae bacterium]|nr:SRPBCC domain-containing protein [Saprospiraceae bacterium]MCB9313036.1 SRPBCC domain-containing protein [Lewinellaceae bacterium]HRW76121.1 SRPBCC domain-containing protein [Saprospiraceae bacterium]